MTTSLKVVTTEETQKQSREQIQMLEMHPQDDWFVPAITGRGRHVWYLRLSITGLFPRLHGPFSSKRKATLFLDGAIGKIMELAQEFSDVEAEYSTTREFERINWGPLIEHPSFNHLRLGLKR